MTDPPTTHLVTDAGRIIDRTLYNAGLVNVNQLRATVENLIAAAVGTHPLDLWLLARIKLILAEIDATIANIKLEVADYETRLIDHLEQQFGDNDDPSF
jgi:hypothetical protein